MNQTMLVSEIFKLGTLVVYAQAAPRNVFNVVPPSEGCVYWKDHAAPQGVGPFRDISSCVADYERTVNEASKRNGMRKDLKSAQVIRVDFFNKVRSGNEVWERALTQGGNNGQDSDNK